MPSGHHRVTPSIFVYDREGFLIGGIHIDPPRVYFDYIGGRCGSVPKNPTKFRVSPWRSFNNPPRVALDLIRDNPLGALEIFREWQEAKKPREKWNELVATLVAELPEPRKDDRVLVSLEAQAKFGS